VVLQNHKTPLNKALVRKLFIVVETDRQQNPLIFAAAAEKLVIAKSTATS